MTQDVEMFEQMYDLNLQYYRELTMYIIAGKKALDKARGEQLEALKEKAETSQMQEDVENYNKYVNLCKAYNLPCDYVIHTVGPIWNGGRNREEELLANCYFNSMKLAMDNGIRSIAFPSISTGVYSFPVELAAKIAVHTVNRFLQGTPDSFDLVEWVLFDTHTESVYEAEVDQLYKMI